MDKELEKAVAKLANTDMKILAANVLQEAFSYIKDADKKEGFVIACMMVALKENIALSGLRATIDALGGGPLPIINYKNSSS